MTHPLEPEVARILVAYWEGHPPDSLEQRTRCRQLTQLLLQQLPPSQAQQITERPGQFIAELQILLEQHIQTDALLRELCRQLAPSPTTIITSRNNIRLLQQYRYILKHNLQQKAIWGAALVPAYISFNIDNARSHIKHIKANLRQQGVIINDDPCEEDEQ